MKHGNLFAKHKLGSKGIAIFSVIKIDQLEFEHSYFVQGN